MAQFVDRPLPASLELPRLQAPRPRDKRLDNLQHLGRTKGLRNKITRDLKEGIIDAAVIVGSDGCGTGGLTGFLVDLAMNHKKAYASLLVKLLPMQVTGSSGTTGSRIGTVNVISIPPGVHLSPEQLALAEQGKPFTIDHDQMREEPAPEPEPIEVQSPEEAKLLLQLRAMSADELIARLGNALVAQG